MRKKQKIMYWFIGVGCGMMLSGLMVTFVGLNLKPALGEEQALEKIQIAPIFESPKADEHDKDETVENESDHVETKKQEVYYKWVKIPATYNATQISVLLESEGIIEDSEAFSNYISKHKLTRKLKSGDQYLPIKGEYDTLLSLLKVGNKN